MKESLPPQILREKLPRFLQKCAEAFESDRRYRNDSRYIRVWIQLMDYVDDARVILRKMENNQIGLKRAMFYSAYALYYEKKKKFEKAENMYRLGVQNLAEPAAEIQKSYDQFLHRMKLLKERKKKMQKAMLTNNGIPSQQGKTTMTENQRLEKGETSHVSASKINSRDQHKRFEHINSTECCKASTIPEDEGNAAKNVYRSTSCGDDTVVVKFVGSAIVGKSEAEDACHHGLVDPTINMKEAMNAIGSMFKEPLEQDPVARRRMRQINPKPKENQQSNVLQVFVDESLDEAQPNSPGKNEVKAQQPFVGAFKIWTEDDDDNDDDEENDVDEELKEEPKSDSIETKTYRSEDVRINGDTVIRRFVGSTVFDDPEVENALHHGLVDPTINLKEAMDDINSMFGKPLNFVRASRPKKQAKLTEKKPASEGFCILADDELEEGSTRQAPKKFSSKVGGENDLFEPTVFTREAMDDINEMFGKSLDF
ncbi:uncharacterized protein A4U43_C02F2840 [Asparagus officinalis]|uniref:BUB1 N-terminal domain-containing protein n=2 Tax=Asparagus officinalis TaxID=4686 RepID=A0A5P1FG84_ASPOF|nr:uncharacterized protein A4U43_C02F2840 [Asparagus officinalis]